jgi:hypothetical protein
MIATAPTPDALLVPEQLKRGATQWERIRSINQIAIPLLGIDYEKDELAWIHKQPGGWLFISKNPEDTIYWPHGAPQAGRHRYAWVDGEGGVRRGYLTEEARSGRRDGKAT